MDISVKVVGQVTIVRPVGEIDSKTAPSFQEKVLSLVQAGSKILLNLSEVGFMSSAGLRVMLLTHRETAAKNAHIVLVGMCDDIKNSMSATGFLNFFTVCDTVEDGMEALQ